MSINGGKMKLSKDSWHYRNFEAWRKRSHSPRHRNLRFGEWVRDEYGLPVTDGFGNVVTHPPRQPDLCTYTRIALLWGPAHRFNQWGDRHPGPYGALIIAVLIMLCGLGGHLLAMISDLTITAWWHPFAWVAATMVGGVVMIGVAVGFGWLMSEVVTPWFKSRKRDQPKEHTNIVVERVKAHKQKVCPIIEFEETKSAGES